MAFTTIWELLQTGADADPALGAPETPALTHKALRELAARTVAAHAGEDRANGLRARRARHALKEHIYGRALVVHLGAILYAHYPSRAAPGED